MTTHVELRPGAYADSVTLLQVSRTVQDHAGRGGGAGRDGHPAQRRGARPRWASTSRPRPPRTTWSSPSGSETDGALDAGLAAVAAALAAATRAGHGDRRGGAAAHHRHRAAASPATRSCWCRCPGASAFVEAMDALDAGRDVMVFSDNVPLDQEVALKRTARRARPPGHGTRLRHRRRRRARPRLRQRHLPRPGRHRRRVRHRLPAGARPARPRRRRRLVRARRRRPRPVGRGARPLHPRGDAPARRGRRGRADRGGLQATGRRRRRRDPRVRRVPGHPGRVRAARPRPARPHRRHRGGAAPPRPRRTDLAGRRRARSRQARSA